VRATAVTAGHCMHNKLTSGSGRALASCYSCCMHSRSAFVLLMGNKKGVWLVNGVPQRFVKVSFGNWLNPK